jgi:hypothetical protein
VPLTDGGLRCAADYHTTGGCYVGLAPLGQNADAWEPFDATFAPSESIVTVYINQEGTAFPAVVRGLAVLQLIGTLFLLASLSFLLARLSQAHVPPPSSVPRLPSPGEQSTAIALAPAGRQCSASCRHRATRKWTAAAADA